MPSSHGQAYDMYPMPPSPMTPLMHHNQPHHLQQQLQRGTPPYSMRPQQLASPGVHLLPYTCMTYQMFMCIHTSSHTWWYSGTLYYTLQMGYPGFCARLEHACSVFRPHMPGQFLQLQQPCMTLLGCLKTSVGMTKCEHPMSLILGNDMSAQYTDA